MAAHHGARRNGGGCVWHVGTPAAGVIRNSELTGRSSEPLSTTVRYQLSRRRLSATESVLDRTAV